MTAFSMVLLEEGVEMELPADLSNIISLLDKEVPNFSCGGYGYQLTSTRAQLRTRWDFVVKLVNRSTRETIQPPVGRIELEKIDYNMVRFFIPPRGEDDSSGIKEYDPDGEYFGSFIYRMLNTFQEYELIRLPGVLPVI